MYKILYKKYKPIIIYVVLCISLLFFMYTSYLLIIAANTKTSISADDLYEKSTEIKKIIYSNKIKLDKDIIPLELNDLTNELLLKYNKINNPSNLDFCEDIKHLNTKIYKNCQYNYFYNLYSNLIDQKGLADKRVCNDIKDIFGENTNIYNRCIYIYDVDNGTKYFNINHCSDLPSESDKNFNLNLYSKEKCEEIIIYSATGKDNIVGKYIKKAKELGELDKSSLGNQVFNKYGTYLTGTLQGVEFYKFDLSNYFKNIK